MSRCAVYCLVVSLACWLVGCGNGSGSPGADVQGDQASVDLVKADVAVDVAPDLGPDLVDVVAPVDIVIAPADVVDVPDVGPCGPACPEGFCDKVKGCLACGENSICTIPNHWCREGMCVETLCIPTSKQCLSDEIAQVCGEDGEAWVDETCENEMVCAVGVCSEVICTPGEATCEGGKLVKCDPKGVAWVTIPCPPGQGCFKESCEPLRHNLLLIFDTSGSMASIGFMDQVPCICGNQAQCPAKPFPYCEDSACPMSKLGLSKHVFNKFFEVEKINSVHLVLTHFPQRIKYPPAQSCNDLFSFGRGWYGFGMTDSDFLTGDDNSHVTEDGGWFDKYLYEILSVPFPTSWEQENLEELKLWVNFDEAVGATTEPCTQKADCPGGFCGVAQESGDKVCWYHTDPELRALTGTPLGRSLFYAGEIYRKQIMPNGKSCQTDADCANRNYYCTTKGICKDPFAHCRGNMILMFTDGVESPETQLGDFFNPRIQAKRFRYGLGCQVDADCGPEATCGNGVCGGYPHPNSGGGSIPGNKQEPWRLLDYNGDPIAITTHVIDLSGGEGADPNKALADDGGGTYYHADLDPNELLDQMVSLLDIKENLMECLPEYDD